MCRKLLLISLALSLLINFVPNTTYPVTAIQIADNDLAKLAGEIRVQIGLLETQSGASFVSFGLPLAPGILQNPANIQVIPLPAGSPLVSVKTRALLWYYDTLGNPTSIRSILIQFPASEMSGSSMTIDVVVNSSAGGAGSETEPFVTASFSSPEAVETTDRIIVESGGTYAFSETNIQQKTLYTGREPRVLATYPDGYLASTGILGEQMSRSELLANPRLQGVRYLSDNLDLFSNSMMYQDGYRMHPNAVYDETNYEGWLYDRCATYLTAYSHFNDPRYLRYALRACSYYGAHIGTSGDWFGIFTGKPEPDSKYSHQRGLFAYYALTGDETALAAGSNIATMWYANNFVTTYRQGHTQGSEHLWTERLLATSLEGLVYGFKFTGNLQYRTAAQELFNTAYRHITTANQAELDAITLALFSFPPQNCFIHSAYQHSEGEDNQPWCSSWMSELIVDPLWAYQEITGDSRVDEVFIRLGRFIRDIGSAYFRGDPIADTMFTNPQSSCYDPDDGENTRTLIPLYGSGIDANGVRQNYGEWSDFEHCADATVLMSSAIRSLARRGQWNNPYNVGPFHTEGEAFVAMFHEFSACANLTFDSWHRPWRDPRGWTSDALADGYFGGNVTQQAAWIEENKIGFPSYPSDPQRKLSWWFNTSMLSFKMLKWTGIDFGQLRAGFIQGQGCPLPATSLPPSTLNLANARYYYLPLMLHTMK